MAAEARFPPETTAVRRARAFVLGAIALPAAAARTLELLVSELATNAVLHARTDFTVCVERRGKTVRVEVGDGSAAPPVAKGYQHDSPTGRGVTIVATLAARWGFEPGTRGKTVWFELDVPEEAACATTSSRSVSSACRSTSTVAPASISTRCGGSSR